MKKIIIAVSVAVFFMSNLVFAGMPSLPIAVPEVSTMPQKVRENAMRYAEQRPVLRYWLYRKAVTGELDAAAQTYYEETCILYFISEAKMVELVAGAADLGIDVTTPRPPMDIPNTIIQAKTAFEARRQTMLAYLQPVQ